MKEAKLVASYAYRSLRYTSNHPLRIPRVSLLLEFLKSMDLLENYVESREASLEELRLFHTEDYLNALRWVDENGKVSKEIRERYNIGTLENPISPAMWKGSVLATGSTVQAVQLYLEGYRAFNPAGGMHHAYPNKAHGFCFINDPAIAINYLKQKGFKAILYIDLDAHHCDGVQDGFYEDNQVFVFSIHQSPEYAFPFNRGFLEEIGKGKGKGYNLNLPMPKGLNDSEFLYALEKGLEIALEVFKPEVYVLQLGTDSLKEDYLSKFELSNWGLLSAFRLIREALGDGIYLGGGGYHPIALARAWALIWCELAGKDIPKLINSKAKQVLLSVDFEEFEETDRSYMFDRLLDRPNEGDIRKEVKEICQKAKTLLYS
ncbi:acetoin utilization protein AcuC [Thermocrinis jamiesonii]|mgnify:FL=1|jgi:Deacetylases, including yeast histone deacetylase and acetoin utilization protein|uniref:acetoin utilization protein AcuC n=1 Tax=Thermocrinis jamiesonii TaxID=1302351 RepID=UPI0004964620|nr:acetoin utilization protein AcuC [Thermocrinis jamiesonii]